MNHNFQSNEIHEDFSLNESLKLVLYTKVKVLFVFAIEQTFRRD